MIQNTGPIDYWLKSIRIIFHYFIVCANKTCIGHRNRISIINASFSASLHFIITSLLTLVIRLNCKEHECKVFDYNIQEFYPRILRFAQLLFYTRIETTLHLRWTSLTKTHIYYYSSQEEFCVMRRKKIMIRYMHHSKDTFDPLFHSNRQNPTHSKISFVIIKELKRREYSLIELFWCLSITVRLSNSYKGRRNKWLIVISILFNQFDDLEKTFKYTSSPEGYIRNGSL